MNWRLQSLLLGVVVFVIVSTLPAYGFQPSKLKAPSKNDFEVFSASMGNDSPVEEWLCPYAYRPVTLDQRNPVLVELLGNFSRLFDAQFNFSQYAASAVLTYRDHVIWEWGKGLDPGTGRTASPDSVFRVGSLSKVFPCLLGLLAESKGLLSLDDPVKNLIHDLEFLDPFHTPNSPRRNSFSWRQLASHTAGLPREAPCTYHSCQRTTQEILQRLRTTRLILPAAARPSYSNLGSALLGHLLAEVFRSDYSTLLYETILKPLNMTSTSTVPPPHMVPPVPNMPLYDLGWLAPAGQLFSTSRDLAKLAMTLNLASSEPFLFGNPNLGGWTNGRSSQFRASTHPTSTLFSRKDGGWSALHDYGVIQAADNGTNPMGIRPSLLRELMFPTFLNPDGTGYGMPWEFEPLGPYQIRNKGGNLQGYSANIALVPELQLGLTITTNMGVDASEWSNYNLAQFIPSFEKILDPLQSMPKTTSFPEKYVGEFSSSTTIAVNALGFLAITKLKGLTANIPLVPSAAEPKNPAVLQIYMPQAILPCMYYEYAAIGYEYVEFTFDAKGNASSFKIPGLMYADTFVRI